MLELQRSAAKLTSAFTEQCVLKLTLPREGKCITLINVVLWEVPWKDGEATSTRAECVG